MINRMKKISYALSFLILYFVSNNVLGQTDYQGQFLIGKNFLKEGKYQQAMDVFGPLTKESEENNFEAYSAYYYSLAALKLGKLNEGKAMVMQIKQRYPDWDKIEDVNYLYANLYFEQQRYFQAVKILNTLNSKELKQEADKQKNFYLQKAPLDTLKNLQKLFPNDAVIAKNLVNKLSYAQLNEKDKMLLEYLRQEFKLEKEAVEATRASVKKQEYHVAVLFPFMEKQLSPEAWSKSYQYVFELYEGMKIAIDSLKKDGVSVVLHPYDTEKDDSKVSQILKSPELANMDLIVGPIFPANYPLVAEFALRNKISGINPLSNNIKLVEGNPYVFLFQPSLEAQAGRAAEMAVAKFPAEPLAVGTGKKAHTAPERKNVYIFFGQENRDSLLATRYKDSIILKGFAVTQFEKVAKDKLKNMQKLLSDSAKLLGVNHIFIAANDQVIAANFISQMEISKFSTPVITRQEWLQFPLLTFEQFERRNVHFINPDYIDYDSYAVQSFRNTFLKKAYIIPEIYAYQGYDMMRFFGNALKNYGNVFGPGLSAQGFTRGYTLYGYNFTNSNSNLFVPIVKFEGNKMVVANPVDQIK